MVDARDFRILAHLLGAPFASYEAVGRHIGLSGNGVKLRLQRMRDEGVLGGFVAAPAAQVFGRRPRIWSFRERDAEEAWVQKALATDPVVTAVLDQDGTFSVMCYLADGDEDTPPADLVHLADGPPDLAVTPRIPRPKDPEPVLSPLDWRILRVLVRRPRASIRDLADATGLAPRTVRHRRDALLADGYVQVMPLLQLAHARGDQFYFLRAYLDAPEARGRVQAAADRCVVVGNLQDPPGVSMFCRAASLADVLADERRLRALDAVQEVGLSIPLHRWFASDRVERWIEDALRGWDDSRRRT